MNVNMVAKTKLAKVTLMNILSCSQVMLFKDNLVCFYHMNSNHVPCLATNMCPRQQTFHSDSYKMEQLSENSKQKQTQRILLEGTTIFTENFDLSERRPLPLACYASFCHPCVVCLLADSLL